MNHFLRRAAAVPLRFYPRIVRHRIRHRLATLTDLATSLDLSDKDLLVAFQASSLPELIADFRSRDSKLFFLGADPKERGAQVAAVSPGLDVRLRSQGDSILEHKFDLLGSGPRDLGSNIPWRSDFISGHEWPLEHFSRLTIVDLDAGFDIKVVWELSRFHQGVTLGQCYALTGEEKYASEFVEQVKDWWSENPAGFGPNWANAMEVAIRSTNWICSYGLLRESPALDEEFTATFLKSLLQHGRYITRYLECGWPGSNHLIADLCGLVYLGVFMSPAPESLIWLRKGLRLLKHELKSQVLPDGADYEGSSSYHLLVTEMLLFTVSYCDSRVVAVPHTVRENLFRMLEVIAGLLRPDGNLPLFGDCDSGRWLKLESDSSLLPSEQDPRGVLALGAVLFDSQRWAALVESPVSQNQGGDRTLGRWEAALWTFGDRALEVRDKLDRGFDVRSTSIAIPDAGWYVMRRDDNYLAMTAGGNGTSGWGGHSHNDALSFELVIGDRAFLVDPGSYSYTGDRRARNLFRSTSAHNTLQVGTQEINRIPCRDMFRLENDSQVTVIEWKDDEDRVLLEAECVCSEGSRRRYSHRRRFEYNHEHELWLITDSVCFGEDAKRGGIAVYFHFARLPLVLDGLAVRTVCTHGPNLAIFPLQGDTRTMSVSLGRGWISPHYGVQVEAPVVRYSILDPDISKVGFALLPFTELAQIDKAGAALEYMR